MSGFEIADGGRAAANLPRLAVTAAEAFKRNPV